MGLKSVRMMWLLTGVVCIFFSGAAAADQAKRSLNGNMTENYEQIPKEADRIGGMFSKGIFYGRLRTNSFLWDWDREVNEKTRDHWSFGIGGSVIFKSAYFNGFALTTGLYTSQSPWHKGGDAYRNFKAGKDLFSRYAVASGNGWDLTVLAQAYLEYRFRASHVKVGRQLFESLLTASNDTKMIPNAFKGISFESEDFPETQIKAAWFDGQKLRDHTSFHHVLAYGDDPENPNAGWTQNDDSAMHRGLTLSKLRDAGIEDRLLIFQVENKTIRNLTILVNATDVPDLMGSITGEIGYDIELSGGFKLGSGIRYLFQRDHGGGEIGGASLSGRVGEIDARGYGDPDSLKGRMVAAKISLKRGAVDVQIGYSIVADDADLVAPWRSFPTGGYTRAMGQYNWWANTETWMVQAGYHFPKAGLVPGLSVKAKYAIQDNDDKKPDVPMDSKVLNVDFIENVAAFPGLSVKLRSAILWGDSDIIDMYGNTKPDLSYREYRLEMNYLF